MDYNRIVQEILNIGEELLKSGAEIFRVEDSLYRMCRSYGFVRSDVYASQINIQMTVETPEGEIITQIRYIEMTSPHYDKLDQLNNLSRYVCANTPEQAKIHERYEKIAKSKVLAFPLMVLAQIVSGTSFAAPWISTKLAYLIHVMGLSREVAKALLIGSSFCFFR